MKKKLLISTLIAILSFGMVFVLDSNVYANSCGGVNTAIVSCADGQDGTVAILKKVMDILLVCVGIFGVVGITFSGIQYLTAAGSEDKTRKAKHRIYEIVIGMAIYVCLYALLDWLLPGFSSNVTSDGSVTVSLLTTFINC